MAEQLKPGLAPLPTSTNGGLKPLSVNGGAAPASPPSAERTSELGVTVFADDPVESFLEAHPEVPVAAETPEAPAASETPATPAAEATPGTPSAEAVIPSQPTSEAQPHAEVPAAKPEAKPTAETPVVPEASQPAQPAAAPRPTYAADEKIALGANPDGSPIEWTRAQVTAALQERTQNAPLVAEATTFREVFGVDAATAKAEWSPILSRLRDEPHTAQLIDSVLSDPQKAGYLTECAAHFDSEVAAGNVPAMRNTLQPSVPPEIVAELKASREWRQRHEASQASDRVQREIESARAKYPFLASDQGLMSDLILSAKALNQQNAAWGIPEAVAAKASIYDALLTARSASAATPTPEVLVPALNGTAGPAPTGTRAADDGRPKKFNDLGDATDEWLKRHPG